MSCVGCGIVDDITEQRIATSGTWGGPGLGGFGEMDTQGQEIYCDSAEELRTWPERLVTLATEDESTVINESFASDIAEQNTPTALVLTNPSAARPAIAYVGIIVKWQFEIDGTNVALEAEVRLDTGSGPVVINTLARTWSPPYVEEITHEEIELDMQPVFLGAGDSYTLDVRPIIDGTNINGPGTGTLQEATVALRALIVVT